MGPDPKSGLWAHNAENRKLVNEAKRLNIGVAHEVSIPDFERRIGLPRGTGGTPFEAYLAIKKDEAVKSEVQSLLVRLKEPARYADVAAPECDAAAFVTDLLDQLRKRAEEHGWKSPSDLRNKFAQRWPSSAWVEREVKSSA